MNVLKRVDKALTRFEGYLLITLLFIMVVMAFLQVVLRNLFSSGILWADVFLRHLLLWLGFLGAAIATSENRHINIDALRRFFPKRMRAGVEVLTDSFAAVICFMLAKSSWTFVQGEIADRRVLFGDIPSWYAQVIIPIGFGLLVVHFAIRAMVHVWVVAGKGEVE